MLEIVESETLSFTSTGIPIEGNQNNNLVLKAYHLLAADFLIPPIDIHLHKRIPMGAGLGGGSSDAAFMLKLLNQKFELGLDNTRLEQYAAQLGSDCPFFIQNQPAYLLGKGHELETVELDLSKYYLVLCYANVHSNTALAYSNVKRREIVEPSHSLKLLVTQPILQWNETIENDFEESVFRQFPILETIKNDLYQQGALYASMSGSGSAVYGLFTQKPQLNEQLRPLVCYEGWL